MAHRRPPYRRSGPAACTPSRSTASPLITSRAAAPSLTPDALPAVTVPGRRNGVFRPARASSEVSRGCSSTSTTVTAPRLPGTSTGTISSASRPFACALAARCWLRSANRSWSSRRSSKSAATFSAVSGIESIPYCCFSTGLTNRHPIVVSKISACREKAVVALGITKGARDIDSTPPARTISLSPAMIDRAAEATASRPDPQSRLIVVPGTRVRQSGQQHRHPGDVAVVLAGLVRAAEDHVVDHRGVEGSVPRQQRRDGVRREVVGTDRGERAAVPADRGADAVHQVGRAGHDSSFDDGAGQLAAAAAELGDHVVTAPDRHVVDRVPPVRRPLAGLGDQQVAALGRGDEDDVAGLRDGDLVPGVAGERERGVGQREDEAAVRDTVAVHHVVANRHLEPGPHRSPTSTSRIPRPALAVSSAHIAAATLAARSSAIRNVPYRDTKACDTLSPVAPRTVTSRDADPELGGPMTDWLATHRERLDGALDGDPQPRLLLRLPGVAQPAGVRRDRRRGRQGRLRGAPRYDVPAGDRRGRAARSAPSSRRTGCTLDVQYPRTTEDGLDELLDGRQAGLTDWRKAGHRRPRRRHAGDPRPAAQARLRAGQRGPAHQRPGLRDGVPGRWRARAGPGARGDRLRVRGDEPLPGRRRSGRSRPRATRSGCRRTSPSSAAGSRW